MGRAARDQRCRAISVERWAVGSRETSAARRLAGEELGLLGVRSPNEAAAKPSSLETPTLDGAAGQSIDHTCCVPADGPVRSRVAVPSLAAGMAF